MTNDEDRNNDEVRMTDCHPEGSEAQSKDPAESLIGFATGFDSLTSRSLSLRPSRPCRGFPSRSILDFARDYKSAERDRPIWNLNFAGAQELPQLNHRDSTCWYESAISEHIKCSERPWDHSVGRLGVVRKPYRSSRTRSRLLASFFRENGCVVSTLGENDATSQSGDASADDRDGLIHLQMVGTDRRAVRKIFGIRRAIRSTKCRATARTGVTRPTMTYVRSVGGQSSVRRLSPAVWYVPKGRAPSKIYLRWFQLTEMR